jgi:asparagine synthase (glutamine-hydrolysing)
VGEIVACDNGQEARVGGAKSTRQTTSRPDVCGLAVMVALGGRQAEPAVLEAMSNAIVHRGPDDRGLYTAGPVGFGFRRLTILDLSPTGHQPMLSADGQLVLIFNGEIYNYLELRDELEALGHTFTSTGDTQVLLAAYRQWGQECLPKLNGMWAFVIYDVRESKLFGSRDRFGVKPLYRYRTGDAVYLASEIKAIRASGHYRGGPNWRQVSHFLVDPQINRWHTGTETFYAGIEQVPAGSAFELTLDGQWKEWRFWSLEDVREAEPADPPRALKEMFEDAVRLRMRSDVPVGVSLSGGIDSTSIICAMARLGAPRGAPSDGRLQAFSYIAPEFDESAYIAETLAYTGAVAHRVPADPLRLWNSLDRMLSYQDEPVHALNALITFDIFELAAANHVKVMLNGGGADEVLAGYFHFFRRQWYTLLKGGKLREVWSEINAYTRVHGGDRAALVRGVVAHLCRSRLGGLPGSQALVRWRRRRGRLETSWFTPDVADTQKDDAPADMTLEKALRRSVGSAPLAYYLRLDDRNSMANSVEVRAPFLDYRLVSLVFGLSSRWKIRGPWNKYVLREAMRGYIPELVRSRADKMGFPVPERQWVRGALYEPLQDLLATQALRSRGFYNVAAIRQDLERHKAGEIDVARRVLAVAQLESWFRLPTNSH